MTWRQVRELVRVAKATVGGMPNGVVIVLSFRGYRVGLCIGLVLRQIFRGRRRRRGHLQQAAQAFQALRFDFEFGAAHVSPAAASANVFRLEDGGHAGTRRRSDPRRSPHVSSPVWIAAIRARMRLRTLRSWDSIGPLSPPSI
jgi:hypothetical protein